jgi:hypothetical protein
MVEAPIIPRITVEPSGRCPSLKVRSATATSTVEGQMVFPARCANSQQASHCQEERAPGLAAGQHSRWSFRGICPLTLTRSHLSSQFYLVHCWSRLFLKLPKIDILENLRFFCKCAGGIHCPDRHCKYQPGDGT